MTPTDDLRLTLRMNLNEPIPEGGTAADTLFTDAEIDNLLMQSKSIEEASWRGWVVKCMRKAEAAMAGGGGGGVLIQAQMGSEQFRWSEPSQADVSGACQEIARYWWDQIPAGLVPSTGGGSRILSIAPVPMPGINVPSYGYGMDDPWTGSGATPWWPGDMSRLLHYIKAGWRWPSAEGVVATIPEQ